MYKIRKKGYSFISLLLLLLIIIIVFNFKAISNSIHPDLSFGKVKIAEMYNMKKDNFENERSVFIVQDGLLQIKDNKLFFINNEYEIKWFKEINGDNIDVYYSDEFIYIIDMEMGDVFKIDYIGNIIAKKYSQGNILKVVKYINDELVVVNEDYHIIKYNKDLDIIKDEDINLNHVFDIRFDNEKYYILNIENKNKIYFTRLVMLNNEFEFISNLNVNEEILFNIFIDSSNKILSGDKKIVRIDKNDEIVWETSYEYLINDIVIGNNIYINLIDNSNDKDGYNFIKIVSKDGIVINEVKSPIDNIKKMLIYNDELYVISKNKVCVLNKELEIVLLKEIEENIIDIELLDNNQILINTENNVIIYQVKL